MKLPKRGTNKQFDRIMSRYQELVNLPLRDENQEKELRFVIASYLEFTARYDPEGFAEEFGQFRVSEEEFKEATGMDPEEFLNDQKKQ